MSLLPKHTIKHNQTLFIECLATGIVETYKHLAESSKEQEKQCLQKWRQNSDFSHFLKISISKLCHRILIIFFQSNMQLGSFWLNLYLCHLHFFKIVIMYSLNPSFTCSKVLFFWSFWRSFWINYLCVRECFFTLYLSITSISTIDSSRLVSAYYTQWLMGFKLKILTGHIKSVVSFWDRKLQ